MGCEGNNVTAQSVYRLACLGTLAGFYVLVFYCLHFLMLTH